MGNEKVKSYNLLLTFDKKRKFENLSWLDEVLLQWNQIIDIVRDYYIYQINELYKETDFLKILSTYINSEGSEKRQLKHKLKNLIYSYDFDYKIVKKYMQSKMNREMNELFENNYACSLSRILYRIQDHAESLVFKGLSPENNIEYFIKEDRKLYVPPIIHYNDDYSFRFDWDRELFYIDNKRTIKINFFNKVSYKKILKVSNIRAITIWKTEHQYYLNIHAEFENFPELDEYDMIPNYKIKRMSNKYINSKKFIQSNILSYTSLR